MKACDLQILGNRCYYKLSGCSNDEFINLINYKSWVYSSWGKEPERRFFSFIYEDRKDENILWSSIGFAPILIRHLEQELGYLINGKELFRSKKIEIGETLFTPYDFQSDARDVWIRNGCFGIIKIPTGGGKSFEACDIISKMKVKTLICVHTNDLLINAWLVTLVEQYGEDIKGRLGIIGGNLSKNDRKNLRLINDTSYEGNVKQDIVIATSQSLINKLDVLCNEMFGLVIVDECHHYSAESFNKVVSCIKAPYKLGLTATVIRPDGTTPLFCGLLGDVIYKITIRELIDKKILVEPVFHEVIVNDSETMKDIAICGKTKLNLSRHVKNKSASSIMKKNFILKLAKDLSSNNKKFIMYTDFVNDNSNGVFVRDYYVKELSNIGIRVVGIDSDMGGVERQKIFKLLQDSKLDGLIFGKLGAEGVNIPKVDSVIMNNASKSTILFPQRVGRAMRTVRDDDTKINAFIYEIIINTPMEMRWSDNNFYEYEIEGFVKQRTYTGDML